MARVTLAGSSHVRRLRDAIQTKSDHTFLEDIGISRANSVLPAKEAGHYGCDIHNKTCGEKAS